MDAKFAKLLEKLKPYIGPEEYVSDKYDINDVANEVSAGSTQLSPEDVHKILNAESTGGQNMVNPRSTASGPFQILDKTREEATNALINDENVEIPVNPLRKDALLMKQLLNKSENALKESQTGPKDPNLENLYLMHHYGVQGGLNALNDPKDAVSKERFNNIRKLLAKKPLKREKEGPAKDLLELLKE